MAKQPDIVGLFTGISDKPIDPTTMTQAQQRGAMRSKLLSSARQGMTNAFGRETKEQKMQAQRADYLTATGGRSNLTCRSACFSCTV
jgi:hypothetical protein